MSYATSCLFEDWTQDVHDFLELLRVSDQRGRELYDRGHPVVGAADQAAPVRLAGEVAAEQLLGLVVLMCSLVSLSLTSSMA